MDSTQDHAFDKVFRPNYPVTEHIDGYPISVGRYVIWETEWYSIESGGRNALIHIQVFRNRRLYQSLWMEAKYIIQADGVGENTDEFAVNIADYRSMPCIFSARALRLGWIRLSETEVYSQNVRGKVMLKKSEFQYIVSQLKLIPEE